MRLLLTNASKHTPYTLSFNSNISTMLRTFSNPQLYAMQEFLQNRLLMEELLQQLRLVIYPIIYSFLYIPGGCLGFLPSTVGFSRGGDDSPNVSYKIPQSSQTESSGFPRNTPTQGYLLLVALSFPPLQHDPRWINTKTGCQRHFIICNLHPRKLTWIPKMMGIGKGGLL